MDHKYNYSDLSIMVADDAAVTLDLLNRYLSDMGCKNILYALNGEEAVRTHKKKHPDIALLDIYMPVKNGIKALTEILANDPSAYVIMVSGDRSLDYVKDSLKIGAKGFIAKPYNRSAIREILDTYLSIANSQDTP